MKRKQQNTILSDNFLVIALITLTLFCSPAFATEKTEAEPEPEKKSEIAELFEYQLENRSDPFLPFIKEKQAVAQVNMDEIVTPDESLLSGLQLFEPDQLKVVGILATGNNTKAMVQDLMGKG